MNLLMKSKGLFPASASWRDQDSIVSKDALDFAFTQHWTSQHMSVSELVPKALLPCLQWGLFSTSWAEIFSLSLYWTVNS